jgi:hypothetical protein
MWWSSIDDAHLSSRTGRMGSRNEAPPRADPFTPLTCMNKVAA